MTVLRATSGNVITVLDYGTHIQPAEYVSFGIFGICAPPELIRGEERKFYMSIALYNKSKITKPGSCGVFGNISPIPEHAYTTHSPINPCGETEQSHTISSIIRVMQSIDSAEQKLGIELAEDIKKCLETILEGVKDPEKGKTLEVSHYYDPNDYHDQDGMYVC